MAPAAVPTLIQDQQQLLDMLRMHAALSDSLFEVRFLQPLQRVASYVNVLPGSAGGIFNGASGLFCAACEAALASFRASDGRIFTGEHGVEERHALEGRWRYVCFLAGLLYPLGRPLAAVQVHDEAGQAWPAALEPLTSWCEEGGRGRVFVTWVQQDAQPGPCALTATFALEIVGRANIGWLNEGSATLLRTLIDIVSGATAARENRAALLVAQMWELVREHEEARLPQRQGGPRVGNDLGPYLLDAVVTLAQSKWEMNRAVTFADRSGVYLQWPQAGADIRRYCVAQGCRGVPATDQALLALLSCAGVVAGEGEAIRFSIVDAAGQRMQAVRLLRPQLALKPHETLDSVAASWTLAQNLSPVGQHATSSEKTQEVLTASAPSPEGRAEAPRLDVLQPAELEEVAQALPGEPNVVPTESSQATGTSARTTEHARLPSPAAPVAAGGRRNARTTDHAPSNTEGTEVKFRSLLPQEVTDTLSVVHAEYLGQIVHRWRNQELGAAVMRPCEHGFAVEVAVATELARDPSKFLQQLADAGWLYTAPSTPRKLFYSIAVTDGSSTSRDCFVLGRHTARKLLLS